MKIKFSKAEITSSDIKDVSKVLKSGWLTHGAYSYKFEDALKKSYLSIDSISFDGMNYRKDIGCDLV